MFWLRGEDYFCISGKILEFKSLFCLRKILQLYFKVIFLCLELCDFIKMKKNGSETLTKLFLFRHAPHTATNQSPTSKPFRKPQSQCDSAHQRPAVYKWNASASTAETRTQPARDVQALQLRKAL